MKMKEMVYNISQECEILYEGVYKGFHYAIVSLSTHPCAYIELTKEHKYYGKDYDDIPIECHGGLTYSSNKGIIFPKNNENHREGFWIGWDYAHCDDYMIWYGGHYGTKKWTTEEIFEEVKNVIYQLALEEIKYTI